MTSSFSEPKSARLTNEKYYNLGHSYILPINHEILNETKQTSKCKYNAHYLSCSCKEFIERTKLYPKRDLRRLCKHLYFSLLTDHATHLDHLTRLLIETNFWFGRQILFKSKVGKHDFYFSMSIPIDKIYVFLKNDKWQKYEYSLSEDFWVDNIYPNNYDKLTLKIKKIIVETINISNKS